MQSILITSAAQLSGGAATQRRPRRGMVPKLEISLRQSYCVKPEPPNSQRVLLLSCMCLWSLSLIDCWLSVAPYQVLPPMEQQNFSANDHHLHNGSIKSL